MSMSWKEGLRFSVYNPIKYGIKSYVSADSIIAYGEEQRRYRTLWRGRMWSMVEKGRRITRRRGSRVEIIMVTGRAWEQLGDPCPGSKSREFRKDTR